MIPALISPAITELQTADNRLKIRDAALLKEIKELNAINDQGSKENANDRESLIALVLAGEDVAPAGDVAARLKTAWQTRAAINDARQSLKPKIAAAKREAATVALKGLKPEHDKIMNRLVTALAEVVAPAHVEIFGLGQQLKDRECGWREGVCDFVPALIEIFGANNAHSPLATLLHEAVRLGYLKASALPKELRV